MKVLPSDRKPTSWPGHVVVLSAGLRLTAAPTFALMAWISAIESPGMAMGPTASAALPVDGMALMYLLMTIFHLPAWLGLLTPGLRRPDTPARPTEGD